MTKQHIALAVICYGDHFLCAVRDGGHLAGYYEFVGGKVEEGESPATALVRELYEELGLTVDKGALSKIGTNTHHYPQVGALYFFVYLLYLNGQDYETLKNRHQGTEGQRLIWLTKDELLAAKEHFPAANQAMFGWL